MISRLSSALQQKLHLEVADAIERIYSINPESLYAETLDDYVADLAHHYGRGGNREKAIQYLQLAAQQAAQRSASSVAIDQLTNALRILKSSPETAQRDHQELILQIRDLLRRPDGVGLDHTRLSLSHPIIGAQVV